MEIIMTMNKRGMSKILSEFEQSARNACRLVPPGVSVDFKHTKCRGTAIARISSATGKLSAQCIKCNMRFVEE